MTNDWTLIDGTLETNYIELSELLVLPTIYNNVEEPKLSIYQRYKKKFRYFWNQFVTCLYCH